MAPDQLQLFFGQLLLQIASGAQVNVQPPPLHEFVQCALLSQMKVHPPPEHEPSHVEPALHVIVHVPPGHAGMHVVFGRQMKSHAPCSQFGMHVPAAHVHEPDVVQPLSMSALPSAAPSAIAESALLPSGRTSPPSGTPPDDPDGRLGAVPSPAAAGLLLLEHAQRAAPTTSAVIAARALFIRPPRNLPGPST